MSRFEFFIRWASVCFLLVIAACWIVASIRYIVNLESRVAALEAQK